MDKQFGKNQSFARVLNNELVLNELRKNAQSGTELASKLQLSNATVSSILHSLLSEDLICACECECENKKGRKRVTYGLNRDYGLVIVFSITNFRSHPVVANMLGETLYECERDIADYSISAFEKEIDNIKEVLKRSAFKDVPLRFVVISLPGLINQKSGELQVSPQFNKDLFSDSNKLKTLFGDAFSCPVILENDTKLMMLAELGRNSFKKGGSGLLAYVDFGIGGAFEFNDKLYLGSRGYSGEIGRSIVKIDEESHHLDEFASLRRIQEKLSEHFGRDVKLPEVISLYNEGDEVVRNEVLKGAKALGKTFKEIIRVFDIDQFVVSGAVVSFGEDYLEEIRKEIHEANQDATCIFSDNGEFAISDGGKNLAISEVLSLALKQIKN